MNTSPARHWKSKMAQAEVLKEFLVSLGFRTDEKALKNFTGGVEQATKSVVKLVAAIQGAALTVGAGVAAFASNLEALYYAAQRTGNSATSIKAFEKAMQNFGAASGEALSSIEALAKWMRYTPGSEGFMQSLGVQTRDANGQLRDTVDIMADLGRQLAKLTPAEQKSYGDLLGISDNVLRALVNGDFARELDSQRQRLKDSGFNKATEDAHKFMVQLRELTTYVEAFGIKVADALMNKLGIPMDKLADWFAQNGPMIADRTADILVKLLQLAEKVGPAIMWLVDKLIAADKATDGWSTRILALVAALNLLGGAAVIGGILKLAGAFVTLGTSVAGAASAGATATAAGGAGLLARLLPFLGRMAGAAGLMLFSGNLNEGEDEEMRRIWAKVPGQGGPAAEPGATRGIRNNNPGNLNYAGQPGAELEPGKKGRFAKFKTPEQGLAALANQLRLYGKRGLNTVRAIIGRYAPSSENDTNAYTNFVERTMGIKSGETVDMSNAGQLAKMMDAIIKMENGRNPYSFSQISNAARGVTVQQTTTINVNGAGDPGAVGQAVAGQQSRVNQDIARSFSNGVQ